MHARRAADRTVIVVVLIIVFDLHGDDRRWPARHARRESEDGPATILRFLRFGHEQPYRPLAEIVARKVRRPSEQRREEHSPRAPGERRRRGELQETPQMGT